MDGVYPKRTTTSVVERPNECGGDYPIGSDTPPYTAYTPRVSVRDISQAEHNKIYRHNIPKLLRRGSKPSDQLEFVDARQTPRWRLRITSQLWIARGTTV